jgi:hypothetical protein
VGHVNYSHGVVCSSSGNKNVLKSHILHGPAGNVLIPSKYMTSAYAAYRALIGLKLKKEY